MAYPEIIAKVRKPSQYLGKEINALKKDLSSAKLKIALAFPDLYEIGMSHLGLKILYAEINKQPGFAAERVFAPAPDYEKILKDLNLPLTSLESGYPLNKFDLLGFSIQHELNYTTVLNMLRLAKIPLRAKNRNPEDPLIIGGGPCALNPEPLASFFDLFILGEAEEVIIELLEEYIRLRKANYSTPDLLSSLAEIKGIYVPSLFALDYGAEGRIKKIKPLKPKYDRAERLFLEKLDSPFPSRTIVPFTHLVHDRIAVEMDRGCTQGCRFCQAGYIYRPARERENKEIIKIIGQSLAQSGYEEFSLLSLSAGDHRNLNLLVKTLMNEFAGAKTALSLPSLRPGTLNPELIEQIKRVRKTGFTLAPEAGTQRLREVINKGISEEDILKTVSEITRAGWQSLKLYFMLGLPTETEEDVQGIYLLCRKILKLIRNTKNSRLKKINVSISFFIPKPHTPFQWCGQFSPSELKNRQEYLREKLGRNKWIRLKWHDLNASFIEAVLARGDRRLDTVLEKALELGCNLDAWNDFFDFRKWKSAFEQKGIDPLFYARRQFQPEEILPWSHLKTGVTQDFLLQEYFRAEKGERTPDCRYQTCNHCGLEKIKGKPCPLLIKDYPAQEIPLTPLKIPHYPPAHIQHCLRIRYEKIELMRFISHLELSRTFYRALRRANIPLAYSQGFHPHPKISFGFPLPLGFESRAEYLDLHLLLPYEVNKFIAKVNGELPPGLKIISGEYIPLKKASIAQCVDKELYLIELKRTKGINVQTEEKILHNLLLKDDLPYRVKEKQINLRPFIQGLRIVQRETDRLRLELTLKRNLKHNLYLKPLEIITYLYSLSPEEVIKLEKIACLLVT